MKTNCRATSNDNLDKLFTIQSNLHKCVYEIVSKTLTVIFNHDALRYPYRPHHMVRCVINSNTLLPPKKQSSAKYAKYYRRAHRTTFARKNFEATRQISSNIYRALCVVDLRSTISTCVRTSYRPSSNMNASTFRRHKAIPNSGMSNKSAIKKHQPSVLFAQSFACLALIAIYTFKYKYLSVYILLFVCCARI